MGADDAVMLSDPGFAGTDVWAHGVRARARHQERSASTSYLTGTQSTDAITGDLPGMLAEYLGVPGLTYAREVDVAGGRAAREARNRDRLSNGERAAARARRA